MHRQPSARAVDLRREELGDGERVVEGQRIRLAGQGSPGVGGGPAGLEAARLADVSGHDVVLLERSDRLGIANFRRCDGDAVDFVRADQRDAIAVVDGASRGLDVMLQRTSGGAVTGFVGWSLLDAVYMTITTLTTVGFREVEPFGHLVEAGVLVAALAVFFLGPVWYGPFLGRPWMKAAGIDVKLDGPSVDFPSGGSPADAGPPIPALFTTPSIRPCSAVTLSPSSRVLRRRLERPARPWIKAAPMMRYGSPSHIC